MVTSTCDLRCSSSVIAHGQPGFDVWLLAGRLQNLARIGFVKDNLRRHLGVRLLTKIFWR